MGLMNRWTDGQREAPEPLEGPVRGTVLVGTGTWFVLFLAQLPFYGWYEEHGHTWLIWTCAAGAGLGLLGLWYVQVRERAIQRDAENTGDAENAKGAGNTRDSGPGDTEDAPDTGNTGESA